MADRVTCASLSRECDEAVLGTASRARRWVLLEQPGAWGADAVADSALPTEVADHLRVLAADVPCRVLLLRRPGGSRAVDGGGRMLFAGVSLVAAGGWLEQLHLDTPEDLLDIDLTPLGDGASVGGAPVAQPLYLVCTNGAHDPCCAEYGLPVARTLANSLPEQVWECSHVGGDRFAANLVCLPEGIFYGRLDADTALQAVAAHDAGRLLLTHLRGRSALPFPVQAAEVLVRRELGSDRLDTVRVRSHDRDGGGAHRVTLDLGDGRTAVATVSVRRDHDDVRPITCAGDPTHPPQFTLDHLDVR